VLSDNCLHSIQAEARSLTITLGGGKRVKDMGRYLRTKPWAIVANFHHNKVVFAEGPYLKFALTKHRIDCILDNVGPT
jgi:hypothetical protein